MYAGMPQARSSSARDGKQARQPSALMDTQKHAAPRASQESWGGLGPPRWLLLSCAKGKGLQSATMAIVSRSADPMMHCLAVCHADQ